MAKMELDDLAVQRIIHALDMMGQSTTEMTDAMLEAGAAVVVKSWKNKIDETRHIRFGTMHKSVKATKPASKDGGRVIEVYPQGMDTKDRKTPVRNAEKAFIINYTRPGDKWVQEAEEEAEQEAPSAMEEVLMEWLEDGTVPSSAGGWASGGVTGGIG